MISSCWDAVFAETVSFPKAFMFDWIRTLAKPNKKLCKPDGKPIRIISFASCLSIFKAMAMAVQCSKLRWRLYDQSVEPLTVDEVFYLATKGGGEFFGKVGSFEEGYEFDAVVIDDASIKHPQELTVKERLERLIYLSDDNCIVAKFINGKKVLEK